MIDLVAMKALLLGTTTAWASMLANIHGFLHVIDFVQMVHELLQFR
jgi:hypothetical protein